MSASSLITAIRKQHLGRVVHSNSNTFSWLFATALICFLFADVVFLRTSLAPIDYTELLKRSRKEAPAVSFIPERPGRQIEHGQGDIGSASFQFEPAIKFMAYCFRHHESPFWDPYSGGGTLGPETVADAKFSPVSVIAALLGGSSRTITFCLLTLYLISTYSLMRVCQIHLAFSFAASVVVCLVFLLNGFALTNLYTAIGEPYFLSPLVLLTILSVVRNSTTANVAFAIAGNVLLFSTTFFPTTILCFIVIQVLVLTVSITRSPSRWRRILITATVPTVVALLLLSFLYFPAITAHLTYLSEITSYNKRSTPGYSLINLLSLFTPKHLWESYRAMSVPSGARPGPYEMFIDYFGIIPILIALRKPCQKNRLIVLALAACLLSAVGQMFDIPPFTLIDKLPFFSFIRNEYWPAMSSLSLAFLAGFGYDSITEGKAFHYPLFGMVSVIACAFFYVYGRVGMAPEFWIRVYVFVFWTILFGASTALVFAKYGPTVRFCKCVLVLLLFGELVFYMNGLRPYRSSRDTRLAETIEWVRQELAAQPGSRLLNIGETGVFPNWGSALQMPELGDLNLGVPHWSADFYHRYIGGSLFLSLAYPTDPFNFTDSSLTLAGIRYIMIDRRFPGPIERVSRLNYHLVKQDEVRVVYENPHPLERAFVVAKLLPGAEPPMAYGQSPRSIATSDDPVLVEMAKRAGLMDASALAGSNIGRCKILEYHHRSIKLECTVSRTVLLVLTDTWTPWWSAYVDGVRVHLGRADMAFRAIVIPAGHHEISFEYAPLGLRLGVMISVITLTGSAALFAIDEIRSRRSGRSAISLKLNHS